MREVVTERTLVERLRNEFERMFMVISPQAVLDPVVIRHRRHRSLDRSRFIR